jgi:lipoprotein-anchoring transpeptidase ErfK/SrfK
MMRRSLVIVAALATACSGVADQPSAPPIADIPPTATTPTPTTETTEAKPVWAGYQTTNREPATLAAMARQPLDVFESPSHTEPKLTLEPETILGTVRVLGVLGAPVDGWLEVMLPVRPNGSTGWVRESDVSLYAVDGEIHVDLSDRMLIYEVDGVEMFASEVGIGSDFAETPTGTFFVTDRVIMKNPGSPWGPHAFGLSAHSDTITEFNGGDGIIGIHGTDNPGSIGRSISLGCIRLHNEMITALYPMVPLGTRVTVSA